MTPALRVRGLGGWGHGAEPFNADRRMWFLVQNANCACCVALRKRWICIDQIPTEFGEHPYATKRARILAPVPGIAPASVAARLACLLIHINGAMVVGEVSDGFAHFAFRESVPLNNQAGGAKKCRRPLRQS